MDEIEYKGYTIRIVQDLDPANPREWDNLGTMVCFHKRYDLGDKHSFSDMIDIAGEIAVQKWIARPLYLYDHSGLAINVHPFACPWDSGKVGYIYVSRERILQEYGRKRMSKKLYFQAENILLQEVATYNEYLQGDVWGYIVTHKGRDVDSVWGYFGQKAAIEDARSAVDSDIRRHDTVVEHVQNTWAL